MARISGMVLGLGLLVVISSLASPASAWDSDDDDNHHKHKNKHKHKHHRHHGPIGPPIFRQPAFAPPPYVDRHDHFGGGYAVPQYQDYQQYPQYQPIPEAPRYEYIPEAPQYQPIPEAPLAPPPLHPSELQGDYQQAPSGPSFAPPAPPAAVLPHERPGQFVNFEAPLYPAVRVKEGHKAPRFAVHKIVAVRSPDPFRFPGCVYVQVCVPPRPCHKVEVDDGGAKIKLDYDDYEVEIKSEKGVVTVEYDD